MSKDSIYTGNKYTDMILNYKVELMKTLGANVNLNLRIPKGIRVDSYDITCLLGNLLDNIINAINEQMSRNVSIDLFYNKGLLVVDTQNECIIKNVEEDIGIENIRKVADKYNGEFEYWIDDNKFYTKTMLYLE